MGNGGQAPPSRVVIGIEVKCGNPANGFGLDGKDPAFFHFSYRFPGMPKRKEIKVKLVPNGLKPKPPGGGPRPPGDNTGDLLNKLAAALAANAGKPGDLTKDDLKKIKLELKVITINLPRGGRGRGGGGGAGGVAGGGGQRKRYLGRITVTGALEVDAGATVKKVGVWMMGIKKKNGKHRGDGISVGVEKWRPGNVDTAEDDYGGSGGWEEVPFPVGNVRGDAASNGIGYMIIGFGEDHWPWDHPDPVTSVRIPFDYVPSSPRAQLEEMAKRLHAAEVEYELRQGWLTPLRFWRTGEEISSFGVELPPEPQLIHGPFPYVVVVNPHGVPRRAAEREDKVPIPQRVPLPPVETEIGEETAPVPMPEPPMAPRVLIAPAAPVAPGFVALPGTALSAPGVPTLPAVRRPVMPGTRGAAQPAGESDDLPGPGGQD